MAQCSGAYIKWRVNKASARSYFSRCTSIYTVTSTYSNPLYDNSTIVDMANSRGTKRLGIADMPVDKEASTHGSKKPKPNQTRMTEWRSLLLSESED